MFAVCVQGFGPQLVQETISFGTVESLFLSPYTEIKISNITEMIKHTFEISKYCTIRRNIAQSVIFYIMFVRKEIIFDWVM